MRQFPDEGGEIALQRVLELVQVLVSELAREVVADAGDRQPLARLASVQFLELDDDALDDALGVVGEGAETIVASVLKRFGVKRRKRKKQM